MTMHPRARPLCVGALACLLFYSVADAWQNPNYPTSGGPLPTQYPSTPYPTAQNPFSPGGLAQPPHQPLPTSRPSDWPGGGAVASDQPAAGGTAARGPQPGPTRPMQAQQASAELPSPQDVQIVAIVGSDPILGSDIMPWVIEQLTANLDKIQPQELEAAQAQLIRQRLRSLIETKSVVADARKNVPKEGLKNIEKNIDGVFEKREVPNLMKRTKSQTRAELVEKLAAAGTSLDREKQAFFEKTLATQWLQEQVKKETDDEITHEQMLAWYRDHLADYETPARVRWQQLTVRVTPTRPKGEAIQRIWELGNLVYVKKVPFAEVAKQYSEGSTAADGGLRDWTTQGSLVSKPLDQALFSPDLPVGKLSQEIEDSQGYHIVLVLEREAAGRRPFQDVQAEIKVKIKKERFEAGVKNYMVTLRKTPVWTIYDGPGGGPNGGNRQAERPDGGPSR